MNIPDLFGDNLISVSWVKILKFFNADPDPGSNPGSGKEKNRIRDGKKSDPGSWRNIPDPQHRLADMFAKPSFYFAIRAKCASKFKCTNES
jgi:hypothetical protein